MKTMQALPFYLVLTLRILLFLAAIFIIWACFNKLPTRFYFSRSDAILHFTGFFSLGALTAITFPKIHTIKILAAIIIFGISLEITQPLFTANRELSLSDMAANALGGIVGYLVGVIFIFILLRLFNRLWGGVKSSS